MLTDLGANDSQFVLACKRGLHSKENKKYFEQLIACDHFLYFKNMMVKKNLQLEEQAYKLLHENMMKKFRILLPNIGCGGEHRVGGFNHLRIHFVGALRDDHRNHFFGNRNV